MLVQVHFLTDEPYFQTATYHEKQTKWLRQRCHWRNQIPKGNKKILCLRTSQTFQ